MRKRESQHDSGSKACTTVLVVDDEPMVLRVCRRVLEYEGHRVLTAQGAEQAIKAVRANDSCIDVLLCDVMMPRVCGGELATELRELEPGLEVIFFSGHVGDTDTQCQIDNGNARFLNKPFVAEELLCLIEDVLATPA